MRECDPLTLKALPQIPSRSPLLYLSSTLALLFPHPFFLLLRLNQAFVSASLPDRRDSGIARLLNHSICPSAGWHPIAAADHHWTKLFFFIPVSTWKLSQYSAEYIKLWGIPKVLLQSFTAVDSCFVVPLDCIAGQIITDLIKGVKVFNYLQYFI